MEQPAVFVFFAIFLSPFYTSTRYPGDAPEFFWKDAEEAFAAADRIKTLVVGAINGE